MSGGGGEAGWRQPAKNLLVSWVSGRVSGGLLNVILTLGPAPPHRAVNTVTLSSFSKFYCLYMYISKKAGSIQGLIGADSLIPCSHGLAGSDTALDGMAYTYL